jgi:hypothetical protein
MEPRNRFQGMNSVSLCSLAGRYDNPIPTQFLVPIDCLKIPALFQLRVMSLGLLYNHCYNSNIILTVCRRNSQNVLLQKLTDQLETVNKEKQLIGWWRHILPKEYSIVKAFRSSLIILCIFMKLTYVWRLRKVFLSFNFMFVDPSVLHRLYTIFKAFE